MSAQFAGALQSAGVARQTTDYDARCSGFSGGDDTRQALLAGPLDQDRFAESDFAIAVRPLDSVRKRQERGGVRSWHVARHAVDDRVRVHIHVLAGATPQGRRHVEWGGAGPPPRTRPRKAGLLTRPGG